jgi:hypothetical protein
MVLDDLLFGPLLTNKEEIRVNGVIWFVSMFLLGIAALGLCALFMRACEKI